MMHLLAPLIFLGIGSFARVGAVDRDLGRVVAAANNPQIVRIYDGLAGGERNFSLEGNSFYFDDYEIDSLLLDKLEENDSIPKKITAENQLDFIKICRNKDNDSIEDGKLVRAFTIIRGNLLQEFIQGLSEKINRKELVENAGTLKSLKYFLGENIFFKDMNKVEGKRINQILEEAKRFYQHNNRDTKALELLIDKINYSCMKLPKEVTITGMGTTFRNTERRFLVNFFIKNYFIFKGRYFCSFNFVSTGGTFTATECTGTRLSHLAIIHNLVRAEVIKTKDADGDDEYQVSIVRKDPTDLLKKFNEGSDDFVLKGGVDKYVDFILSGDREEVEEELNRWKKVNSQYIVELSKILKEQKKELEEKLCRLKDVVAITTDLV